MEKTIQNGTVSLEERILALEKQIDELKKGGDNSVSLICFSGEWDKLFAALTIGCGALAMGSEVHLFFTFWAVTALRQDKEESSEGKSTLQNIKLHLLIQTLSLRFHQTTIIHHSSYICITTTHIK